MDYKGSQPAIVKINGKAILFFKMHFLINYHMIALYAVEIKIRLYNAG